MLYNAIEQLEQLNIPVSSEQRQVLREEERKYLNEEVMPLIKEEVKDLTEGLRCRFKIIIESTEDGDVSVRQVTDFQNPEEGRVYGDHKKKYILNVIFPDGSSVCQQKVSETLAEVVRRVGVDKVRSLNLQVVGHDFISADLHQRDKYRSAQLKVAEDLYVMTYCSTDVKLRIIKEISSRLQLGLKVEKVML